DRRQRRRGLRHGFWAGCDHRKHALYREGGRMTSLDFGRRCDMPELMDGDGLGFDEYYGCLRELEAINRLTRAYAPTLRWMRRFARAPVCVLDAGCGSGDML